MSKSVSSGPGSPGGWGTALVAGADDAVALLADVGWDVETCEPEALVEMVEREPRDAVFLTVQGDEGLERIAALRRAGPDAGIVALCQGGALDAVVEAMQRGADHGLTLPLEATALRAVAERVRAKASLARQAAGARARAPMEGIVGAHPAMQRLLDRALQAARSRATVLIKGETGTGKELIAAAIHHQSRRAQGPFVRLNCASLAESVLESELFGHEKGAFTGAAGMRRGRFEQAHTGTLFLDEVSEIPLPVQVKLLRFLQERQLERVGGDETLHVDVRVVAATNRDLKAMVEDRLFREDLFYRLNVVRLEVPPLRVRPSDIPLLADHFLRQFAEENEKRIVGIEPAARQALLAHPWPGNVRELMNVIEQAVVFCEGDQLGVEDLPLEGDTDARAHEPLRLLIPGVTLAELERYAIEKTLDAVGGSPTKAAAILGVSRRTIQYRMREWGLRAGDDEPPSG